LHHRGADAFEADTGARYLLKAEAAHYRRRPAVERASLVAAAP
jgi:hypothetical protein